VSPPSFSPKSFLFSPSPFSLGIIREGEFFLPFFRFSPFPSFYIYRDQNLSSLPSSLSFLFRRRGKAISFHGVLFIFFPLPISQKPTRGPPSSPLFFFGDPVGPFHLPPPFFLSPKIKKVDTFFEPPSPFSSFFSFLPPPPSSFLFSKN